MNTVQDVLKKCTIDGNIVKLPTEQINPTLFPKVKDAIVKIGGVWKGGKIFGFVFKSDPTERMNDITDGIKRNIQQEQQAFFTQPAIADRMVKMLNIKVGDIILEPSAGEGALIDAVLRLAPKNTPSASAFLNMMSLEIFYCENYIDHIRTLHDKYDNIDEIYHLRPLNDDFLQMGDLDHNQYDCIIANPPFTKNQDIKHILKMFDLLKPGGRIVTIASIMWEDGRLALHREFNDFLKSVKAKIERLPKNTFKDTPVETLLITIDK